MTSGTDALGDSRGPVAICTLTRNDLFPALATLPGVASAGRIYGPNLGIDFFVDQTGCHTGNRRIRH